jgi:CRP/FNR family transcriptional regulator, cyclic AMP receptor protein
MAAIVDPNILKDQPLCSEMDQQDLENMAPAFFERSYTNGAVLFVEGMTGEVLYLIRSGQVEIVKMGKDAKEVVLATLQAGEFLGEMSLMDNLPRTATARIKGEAVCLAMTRKAFVQLTEKHPGIAVKLLTKFLRTANDRLRKANESIKQI